MVMATFGNPPYSSAPTIGSYQTALCIIPPANLHPRIDSLRALYDKAHGRWPPHINLIYPFVAIESLLQATDLIRSKLRELGTDYPKINLHLDISDHFSHRHSNTVFIAPSQGSRKRLETLRNSILDGFNSRKNEQEYHPHLTIGQTPANAPPMREYLLDKARLLLPIEWQVNELVVLVRDKMLGSRNTDSCMRIWGSIDLAQHIVKSRERYDLYENNKSHVGSKDGGVLTGIYEPAQDFRTSSVQRMSSATLRTTYYFSPKNSIWRPVDSSIPPPNLEQIPNSFRISSYNVLHDSSITIAADERYPILLKSILHNCALSDVLVLQEVSDDFLSYLLSNDSISSHYPFATHAPINPLPSLRNIVVLCRWNFTWEYLSVEQRHKGAAIVQFSNIGISKDGSWKPLILAGVHLSSGLSDAGVAARKSQIEAVLNHLSKQYATNPWVIAGDFNISASPAAIEDAIMMKAITAETAHMSESLIPMLDEKGLVDTWLNICGDSGDSVYGGDAGATFDPMKNPLAAETVRNAGSKNMQPRRYDRIFIKGGDLLEAKEFNMFGLTKALNETAGWKEKHPETTPHPGTRHPGSDHYGIRAIVSIGPFAAADMGNKPTIETPPSTINLYATPPNLSDSSILHEYLNNHSAFPSEAQSQHRKEILSLLDTILQNPGSQSVFSPNPTVQPPIILLPVGSYALKTYLPTSDLDVLALGASSASSFFTTATRRLQKFKESGIKILRRVDASTGTMLELEIKGVRCDLQYCCAPAILPKWREISSLQPLDPIFQLPIQNLQKLNSYRDIEYLKRELPNIQMREFRLAHRFLHIWARERGVYAGKFGFLNGFAITLMLFGIVRHLLHHDSDAVTASNLVCTFFSYYASFDWTAHMVLDTAFAVEKKQYRRNAREVMVVLSLHAPRVNVMRAASLPALRTIREELQRAERLLAEPLVGWESLIGGPVKGGLIEFLKAYKSYVKIDVHYWGAPGASGSSLVGWLESRCVTLLVDLSRKVPGIQARIWPARFALHDNNVERNTEEGYQGCYLIGLRRIESVEKNPMSDSDRKLAQNALRTTLESFADLIRGDEKYFDSSTSWIDVNHVKQSDVGELTLDGRDWGTDIDVSDQSDIVEEQESTDKGIEVIFGNGSDDEEVESSIPKMKSKATTASNRGNASPKPASSNKLRPASDVLSRLRWDPDLDSGDYVVGYIDRFLGTKEQGLETWKSEQTDEEFIPQHRIVYFRRKSDDVRVWDRETRSDLIFGSGFGKG